MICPSLLTVTFSFWLFVSVVIMSSIMEHMCADVFQQTGAVLRPPVEGQEPIPYRNLLPTKEPIHKALSQQFQTVLRKAWVDSRAFHVFESLLNMGGVFWFTNNLIRVTGLKANAWWLKALIWALTWHFFFRNCWRKHDRSGPIGSWSYSTASSAWTLSRSLWRCSVPSCPTCSPTLPTGTAFQTLPERLWPSKSS